MMNTMDSPATVFVVAVLVAVTAQALSSRMRLPAMLLWLGSGMFLGPFGLHVLHVETIKPAMHALIELGLAIILFEGGLNINLRGLRAHGGMVARLLIFPPLLTIIIGGTCAHILTGINWHVALLFGALVSMGGPTVIMPIVRHTRMDRHLRHTLTGEAMLGDATGAILSIMMLQLALTPDTNLPTMLQDIIIKALIGSGIGFGGGWLLSKALLSSWLKDTDLRSSSTLAAAWGLFILANHLSAQAGLLAVLVAGVTLQRMNVPDIERLRYFKASLSVLLISLLFVLLAADINLPVMMHYLGTGLIIFVILALCARPIGVFLSALGSKMNESQTAFLAAMAPRGIVVVAITSLFSLVLKEHGIPGADILEPLVYTVVIISVITYGGLASHLSRWLKVEGSDDHSILIIGGGQIGAELGRVMGHDREIRFLDMNREVIDQLQRSGHIAVRGNALDPIYMDMAHAEEVAAIVVMTGSSDHNLLIARMASDRFHPGEIYVTLQEEDEIKHAQLMHQLQAKRLFAKPYTYTYWNDQAWRKRLSHEIRWIEEDSELIGQRMVDVRIPHGVQPMSIIRDGYSHLPHDDFIFAAGDEIRLMLRPERIQEGQPLILPAAKPKTQEKS